MAAVKLHPVRLASMFVSKPDPIRFGNERNQPTSKWTSDNWLTSRFHFSFAEWGNGPANFGPMRVMNDDTVQPMRGFGTHPHREMEIFTYVVSGQLTHKDSMGNEETLEAGSVQYISAGTGLYHSEYNAGEDPVRFIQMWAHPRKRGLDPRYGSTPRTHDQTAVNGFSLLVDDIERQGTSTATAFIHQDLKMSVGFITDSTVYDIAPARKAYVLCISGNSVVSLDGSEVALQEQEAVRAGSGTLKIRPADGVKSTHILIVDVVE